MWVKKLQDEKHIRLSYLISNFEQLLFWALVWPRSKWKWDFFLSVKKFQSSGVPIGLLTTKKSFSHILENIKESAQTSFERFLMNTYNARSVLVIFQLKKNLSSNCCKPIRVLTRTKSSCSDDRLPLGYLLPDFQPHRSNFLVRLPLFFTTRKEGGRHGGNRAHRTFVQVSSSRNYGLHLCYLLLKSQPIWSDFFLAYEQRLQWGKFF